MTRPSPTETEITTMTTTAADDMNTRVFEHLKSANYIETAGLLAEIREELQQANPEATETRRVLTDREADQLAKGYGLLWRTPATAWEFLISRGMWLEVNLDEHRPGHYDVNMRLDGSYGSREMAEEVARLYQDLLRLILLSGDVDPREKDPDYRQDPELRRQVAEKVEEMRSRPRGPCSCTPPNESAGRPGRP